MGFFAARAYFFDDVFLVGNESVSCMEDFLVVNVIFNKVWNGRSCKKAGLTQKNLANALIDG